MNAKLTKKIRQDFETLIDDAESLLKATASQTGERIEKGREHVQDSLRAARQRLADAKDTVDENLRDSAESVDDQVHDHPYATAGIAACVGLVIGLLIARG